MSEIFHLLLEWGCPVSHWCLGPYDPVVSVAVGGARQEFPSPRSVRQEEPMGCRAADSGDERAERAPFTSLHVIWRL